MAKKAHSQSPLSRSNSRLNRDSPRTRHADSPARQIHVELEATFAQLQLYDIERQKLYAFNRKSVQDDLDARELAQAVAHKTEIDDAIARHEDVRLEAVAVLEAHMREEEEKRRRREEEERRQKEEEARRRAEEQRRIQEEAERRVQEEKERAEASRRAAVEKAKAEQDQRDRKDREATAENERVARAKAESDAQALKDKQEAEAARVAAAKSAATASGQPTAITGNEPPWSSHPGIRHKNYLEIHQRLKTFRKEFWANSRQDPQLKPVVGDMRRLLKTTTNQLSLHDRESNLKAAHKARDTLLRALQDIPSPPVAVNDFLPPHLGLLDKNTTTVPSLVIYLLSIYSKAVISAFAGESTVADPMGSMVSQIFSMPQLQFQRNVPSSNSGIHYSEFGGNAPTPPMEPSSVSLITIFVCKLHAVAPILFGISGNENTVAGRSRLGWRREFAKGGAEEKSFVSAEQQYGRTIGIGAGYAAVALRNFTKSKLENPYPPYHFWESLSHIVNTNPAHIQPSHLYLLKSMFDDSLTRFLQFFGDEGIAALRKALIDLPRQLPPSIKEHGSAKNVIYLVDTWKKEKNFHLDSAGL